MTFLRLAGALLGLAAVWAQQSPLTAAESWAPAILSATTDAFINSVLKDWNTPGGVSVAVVRQDARGEWQVETKGYGNASLDGTPMTEHHLFGIASNSKVQL
jgi:CubicO group peptidase (beta-lactamase class C family)